jgi:hypothetical protein
MPPVPEVTVRSSIGYKENNRIQASIPPQNATLTDLHFTSPTSFSEARTADILLASSKSKSLAGQIVAVNGGKTAL